jgi:Protein of unknown function (DUF1402)
MATINSNDSKNVQYNSEQLAGFPGKKIPYTERAPWQPSDDADAEKQRQEVLAFIQEHADDIVRAALKYNVPPEAIAGAILWEAIENYKPKWLDNAGPGRVHFETAVTLWKDGKVPSGYTPADLKNPIVAIEYIAAIMNESAENYELIAGVDIRNNVGVLTTLYQGGDSKGRAEKLRDVRRADLAANRPLTSPVVPPKEMGEYVKKYKPYIRNNLLGRPRVKEGFDKEKKTSENVPQQFTRKKIELEDKLDKQIVLAKGASSEIDSKIAQGLSTLASIKSSMNQAKEPVTPLVKAAPEKEVQI